MNKYHVYDNYLKEFPDEKGYFGEFGGAFQTDSRIPLRASFQAVRQLPDLPQA